MANRYDIGVASPMAGLSFLGKRMDKRRDYSRALAKENAEKKMREKLGTLMKSGNKEQLAEFITQNPGAQKIADDVINFKSDATKRDYVDTAKKILIDLVDPAKALADRAQTVMTEGGDAAETIDAAKQAVEDPEKGKEWALKALQLYDNATYKSIIEGAVDSTEVPVGSQEILEDGTIIQSTAKGPVVYNPQGEKVTGQAAADAVKVARAEKVSNLRKAAGQRRMATLESELELKGLVESGVINQKEAAKISTKAFDKLEGINQNIANLDEGIRLLKEEGANTGVIDKYLPSFKKSTIRLNNLQGQLGLDVLRNTTFGALSASELAFALDTAMPKGLQPLELAAWFEEKKTAQEKLADYVESAAIYLGTPGNTVASWMQKKREEAGRTPVDTGKPEAQTTQTLNFDAQGNLIQ